MSISYGIHYSRFTEGWPSTPVVVAFHIRIQWPYDPDRLAGSSRDLHRLMSSRVLNEFADFHEVNLFLRGMVPLVGFQSDKVYYARHERMAGESHYPLSKMLHLAFDGITSLSVKPISMIVTCGTIVSFIGFIGILWAIICAIIGHTVAGWASIVCIICFLGGIQLLSLGIIGEYIGKIYLEAKQRPRYIISERTWQPYERHYKG